MKYIIKESAAKQLAFEGIKDVINELGLERREFDSFILYSMTNEDDLGYDPVVIEYDSEDGRLYVQIEYFENLLSLFGYNTIEEQKEIFELWFNFWEGIKPEYTQF
jgi:hypothetical protein